MKEDAGLREHGLDLLLILVGLVPNATAAQQRPEPPPIEPGVAAPPGPYAPGVDILHYDLELSLQPPERMLGRTRIRLRLTEPVPDTLTLDLTGLWTGSVRVDGQPIDVLTRAGRLAVPLATSRTPGDTLTVTVEYGGVPDDGLIIGTNIHGDLSAFADNWPNRARFWFPSVDHPSDKATAAFTVHAPSAWKVVANGRALGEREPTEQDALGGGGDRLTSRWRTDVPIPTYTMVVGAAELEVTGVGLAACGHAPASPRPDGCVVVSTWLFPESVTSAAPSFRRAAEMTDFFTGLIGPFPYEKLAHVQSATRFGGMENASAIFYSEQGLSSGRDMEGTVSHEIAHQWFGDSVTEADWAHLWLSEGFATYFGNLFFEQADGPASMRMRMAEDRDQYLSSEMVHRPIVTPDERDLFDLLNANNYQKGGWVLHMLRDLLGDDVFFRGIRSYYARHAHGTVWTDDFRVAMEETSGRPLGWFFEQWIYEPGHPILRVRHEPAGRDSLTVRVEQIQAAPMPTFRFPLTLELLGADGERQRERIFVDERRQSARLAVAGPVSRVLVDPGDVLLKEIVP